MNNLEFRDAKDRLSVAAAKLLAGDVTAAGEADEALAEIKQLLAARQAEATREAKSND